MSDESPHKVRPYRDAAGRVRCRACPPEQEVVGTPAGWFHVKQESPTEFAQRLAKAMAEEFAPMLTANEESWQKVAQSISEKMGVQRFTLDENPKALVFWLKP